MPREQLVREQADRVDVHAMICSRIRRELLGRHVGRRADRHAGGGAAMRRNGRTQRLRDAEVGDERVQARRQDVVGLDVAVHHAARMRVRECVHHVVQDAHDIAHRQALLPRERARAATRPR